MVNYRTILSAVLQLQTDVKNLKADNENLKARLDREIQDRQADVYALNLTIETLEDGNKKLKAENRNLIGENKARKADDFRLQMTIRNLQDDNREVKEKMEECIAQNTQLSTRVEELEKEKQEN